MTCPRTPNSLSLSVLVKGMGCSALVAFILVACGADVTRSVQVPRPAPGRTLEPALAAGIVSVTGIAERALEAGEVGLAADSLMELGYRFDAGTVFDLAREAYRGVVTLQPKRAEALVSCARMEKEFGQPAEALALLARVDVDGLHGATVAWRRGLLFLALDDLDEADAAFELATELAPGDISGWIGRARVALQREEYEGAQSLLQEALACNPGDSYACELLARAFSARGAAQQAQAALAQRAAGTAAWRDPWREKVLEYAVGFSNSMRRAEALMAARRLPEALAALDRLALERPENVTIAAMRAFALLDLDRAQEALALIEASLRQAPEHFRLHLDRALILQRMGDSRGALTSAQEAVRILPGYASGHALVAELFADLGAIQPAREALETARKLGAPVRILRAVGGKIANREAGR